jgi:hypothetical protein
MTRASVVAIGLFASLLAVNVLGYEGYDPAGFLDDFARERAEAVAETGGYLRHVFLGLVLLTIVSLAVLFTKAVGALLRAIRRVSFGARASDLASLQGMADRGAEAYARAGMHGRAATHRRRYGGAVDRGVTVGWLIARNILFVLVTLIALAATTLMVVQYALVENLPGF